MNLTVKKIDKQAFSDAKAVRTEVFCSEQGFLPEYEFDEHDEFTDDTSHFVVYDEDNGLAVGVGRIIFGDEEYGCKIGRIAVLKSYRKYGVGRVLMNAMIDYAKLRKVPQIVVDSQLKAMGFYAKFGFVPFGEEHPDQHVMHKFMRLNIE